MLVTMKRGLAAPFVHSALPITRRLQLQLFRVRYAKSANSRAGLPVLLDLRFAFLISGASQALRRLLPARPSTYWTLLASHQLMRSSRQNPLSARITMDVVGQRTRIWARMRATSSTLPSAASTLDERSLAARQMAAAEDVQRQIAVAVVVAVEGPPFLLP